MDTSDGQTFYKLVFFAFVVIRSSCAFLDTAIERSPALSNPHNPRLVDDSEHYFCDFESFCSWSFSNHSSEGDWYITSPQKNTPTQRGVRPRTDHSTGTSEGHFLLFKPTVAPMAAGRCSFTVTSPVMPNSGQLCRLRLARFQPEPHTGNLSAFVKYTESAATKPISLTAEESGRGRAQWELLDGVIGLIHQPFQVMLQLCSGPDAADLALDSLELRDCRMDYDDWDASCEKASSLHCHSGECIEKRRVCDFHADCPQGEDEGSVCNSLALGSHCSFEAGLCGWSMPETQFSWKRVSGQNLTETTDLLGTILQKHTGHFLFLKVRGRADEGEAWLQSPAFPSPLSNQHCELRFSLYLFGDFNGTLLLSALETEDSTPALLWEKSGHYADDWHDVTVQITEIFNGFRLTMQAMWSWGSRADIALDGISLSAACFESDLNEMLLRERFHPDLDSFSPLPEPSASEVPPITWLFTSCGASGPFGPTQAQCDGAYRNTNVSVLVGKEDSLKGVQMWKVPANNMYKISAYGAAGGKGAKNHNKRSHGVIISAIFSLEKGDTLYILIGHQGEDACPGRKPLTHKICLGESSVIEDGCDGNGSALEWSGGGGGGGGATYIFRMDNGVPVPLLIAAGGGGKAYLENPESNSDPNFFEQYENDINASGDNGKSGASGGGGGWSEPISFPWAGKSLVEGGQGGSTCPQALSKLGWATFGGFGGGGGPCTAGGGGGGYKGGDAPLLDSITTDGQDGVSFIHPMGNIFLHPLAVMESHGEAVIEVFLNCTHCQTQNCMRDEDTRLIICLCDNDDVLAPDNVTCIIAPLGSMAEGPPSLVFILAVVASTVVTGVILTCASLTLSKKLFQFCVNSVPSTFHRL